MPRLRSLWRINRQITYGHGKPIGHDLASSKEINDVVASVFNDDQVFRIDHYLGKETVLNLLALRFANSIFTTNWDHNTIDSVQITVAEEVGIEGRWEYFDHTGQLRDMVQNHLLQILTFVAMEPPVNLEAQSIHNEKLKYWMHYAQSPPKTYMKNCTWPIH